jgi:branched-chain amino acid transport system ATP-binding protein
MLVVENLQVRYGRVEAVRHISFDVRAGEVVAIIGANGAGKSTTLMALSGITRAAAGRVLFEGNDIIGWAPHAIVRRGIVQVPEGRHVLPLLSVEDNLDLGGHLLSPKQRAHDRNNLYQRFPRLRERRAQAAGTLSGGEQQMLAIARALMSRPRLLLLDEPSLGLAPNIVTQIFAIINELNADGTTVLLVEQNATMALGVADRGFVLENGHIALSGDAAYLRNNPKVRSAYLGV